MDESTDIAHTNGERKVPSGDGTADEDAGTTSEPTEDTQCVGIEVLPEQVEIEVPVELTTTEQVLLPVAFYILLDNSLSMVEPLPDSDELMSRWDLAVSSLTEFVTSPASAGIEVAIQYFNPAGGLTNLDPELCDGSFHAIPDVEMGLLPDNAEAIVASLDDTEPTGYTPTVGALTGGVQYCEQFQAENADTECLVLLVTDGVPRTCGLCEDPGAGTDCFDPMSDEVLVPIAEAGVAAGVRTFTVGMDGVPAEGFELLDAIARAGGTDCTPPDAGAEACNVSSMGPIGLIEALTSIRESVVTETVTETMTVIETTMLDCQWLLPQTNDGEMVDPKRVNVTLSLDGDEAMVIPKVARKAACAPNDGVGWYYDDPANPTVINACPESCSAVQTGVRPRVHLLLGCAAVVAR